MGFHARYVSELPLETCGYEPSTLASVRSSRSTGLIGAALTLGTAAAAALGAPPWLWIGVLAVALLCAGAAADQHLNPRVPETPSEATGRAGYDVRVGGNIEPSGAQAGRGVGAGGDIQGAPTDRIDLLRDQYNKGRALQRRSAWAGGRYDTPEQARDGEDRARYDACKWGQGAWEVIEKHFSGHDQAFFGDGPLALGKHGFLLACQQEIEKVGGSADSYLERKLTFIAALLRRYD